MPDAVKCASGGALAEGASGGNPVLEASEKEYTALLNKNCNAIYESAECFAKEARKYNSLVAEIHTIGEQDVGGGLTVNDAFEIFGSVSITDKEQKSLQSILSGEVDADYEARRPAREVARIGTKAIKPITGNGNAPITMDIANNPGYPGNLPTLADAAQTWKRGSQSGNRSGYRGAATGAAVVETGGGKRLDKGSIEDADAMRRAAENAGRNIKEAGGNVEPLRILVGKLTKLKSMGRPGSQLDKCAAKLDEKFNQDLDSKRGYLSGDSLRGGKGGTPEQRAAAAEGIIAMTGAEVMAIPVIEYKEQCILLGQIATLANYSRTLDDTTAKDTTDDGEPKIRRRLPYRSGTGGGLVANAPLIAEGQSFGFINKLTQYSNQKDFFNATNAEISSLQPLIRLYRIQNANSTRSTKEVEIPFDSNANRGDITDLLKNKDKRGFGIGISSFNLVFDGQDLFAQKRCIKAVLKLHAADFDELLKPRTIKGKTPKEDTTFRYIDLALKTGKSVKAKNFKEDDDLNFRLKAVFGWASHGANNSPIKGNMKKALDDSFVSVNLTPVTHEFGFDDLGRVTFSIEYFAYVEEYYSKSKMNIFTHVPTNIKMLTRKLAFETIEETVNCTESAEAKKMLNNVKTEDAAEVDKDKQAMHAFLFKQMFKAGYIHVLNFTREDLKAVLAQGPSYALAGKVTKGSEALSLTLDADLQASMESQMEAAKEKKDGLAAAMTLANMDSIQLPFFFIGDMLNVILGSLDDSLTKTAEGLAGASGNSYKSLGIDPALKKIEIDSLKKAAREYKKFRVVLGPLEIVDHGTSKPYYVNFADIPVSVKYFSEWLTSKLLKKNQAIYPLTQFLKDLFNDLVKNYLNEDSCYPFSIKQKVRLYESVITSYPKQPRRDEITRKIENSKNKFNRLNLNSVKGLPILNIKGQAYYDKPNPGANKEMNYFIFHAGRTQPLEYMRGIQSQDESRGIFHYVLGKDRGIVKNISLQKTDSPGLKEVRFEQEGYDGLHQLREIYDVNITSYANITAFPGAYIFVDPKGFAPSMGAYDIDRFDLTDLGVGGYYMITKAEHDFAPGVGETRLTAVWVSSIDQKGKTKKSAQASKGANQKSNAKCKVYISDHFDTLTGQLKDEGASFEATGPSPDDIPT